MWRIVRNLAVLGTTIGVVAVAMGNTDATPLLVMLLVDVVLYIWKTATSP